MFPIIENNNGFQSEKVKVTQWLSVCAVQYVRSHLPKVRRSCLDISARCPWLCQWPGLQSASSRSSSSSTAEASNTIHTTTLQLATSHLTTTCVYTAACNIGCRPYRINLYANDALCKWCICIHGIGIRLKGFEQRVIIFNKSKPEDMLSSDRQLIHQTRFTQLPYTCIDILHQTRQCDRSF